MLLGGVILSVAFFGVSLNKLINSTEENTMETITFELPDFWATALFYDDTSSFEFDDEKPFQEFCLWMQKHYGTSEPVDMDEEPSFSKYHDATKFGVLACNVHKYTFIINNGNPKTSANITLAHTIEGE